MEQPSTRSEGLQTVRLGGGVRNYSIIGAVKEIIQQQINIFLEYGEERTVNVI